MCAVVQMERLEKNLREKQIRDVQLEEIKKQRDEEARKRREGTCFCIRLDLLLCV